MDLSELKKIPVILDGDPGHDDAIAWMLTKASPVFAIVAAGRPEDGYCYPVHHPKACFDDAALPAAAAAYTHIALQWLKQPS